MWDHAYRVEVAHSLLALSGFLLAVWNSYDEWCDCEFLDLDVEPARAVLRAYEHAGVSILVAVSQMCSLVVSVALVMMPPPPLPSLVQSPESAGLLVELMRSAAISYWALVTMSILLLCKSLFRRISRRIYTRQILAVMAPR